MRHTLLRPLAVIFLVLFSGCAGYSKQILLDYQDFGPQMIASEVVGTGWWQWQNHGNSDPAAAYDIKVAVYRGVPLAEVRTRYPVNPEQKKDVRYLEYQKALGFLDEKIAENVLESVTERLKATRKKIIRALDE